MKLKQLFEQHFNMLKISTAFYGMYEHFNEKQDFLMLKFLLYFPIRTQLLCLSVCSGEASHPHKTGLFFIPVSTCILLLFH